MAPEAIAIIAIMLALALGYAVSRSYYRPKHSDLEQERVRLMREYADAQRRHGPSEKLWQDLRKVTTEQLRVELEKESA